MSVQDKLRWGIVGAARINERMLPAIVAAANAELVAIGSRRPGAAADTLARYGGGAAARAYDRLEEVLADPDMQAVYLPMANHEHAEWVLKALACGKHVLCEKPLALQVADVDAMAAAAREHGRMLMEGFMYLFHPQHARIHEWLASGLIGEVRTVRASFSFMMRPARQYRLAEPQARGGGALWDIGCYAVHALRRFFDHEPLAVTALASLTDSGADSACGGVFEFGQGRFAHFDVSFDRARRCEYEITGTQGGVKCHVVWQLPGDVPVLSWWTEDGRQGEERLPTANHFVLEIEHFSRCVLTGAAPLLTLADARANCQAMVAVLRSIAERRTVAVSG